MNNILNKLENRSNFNLTVCDDPKNFSDGYEFECGNIRIGKSTHLNAAEVDMMHSLWIESNDQNIFVFCKKCNTYMYFEKGKNNALYGKYICPVCGRTVKESTPYTKLKKENETFLSKLEDDNKDY